jgi:hypothetical protein
LRRRCRPPADLPAEFVAKSFDDQRITPSRGTTPAGPSNPQKRWELTITASNAHVEPP